MSFSKDLIFLRSPTKLSTTDAQTLPTRLKILNWGRNESTEGVVILDEASAVTFAANQSKIGRERCALDFEHNTVPGSDEYDRTEEPRKVAAFGAPKIIFGDGLYLENIDWRVSPETTRNYEDLSAAPLLDSNRRVIALHSAALTKAGAVYNLSTFFEQARLSSLVTGKTELRGLARAIAAHVGDPKEKGGMEKAITLSAGGKTELRGLARAIALHKAERGEKS